MLTVVMYISWRHIYLTELCIPYVGMIYGYWQQSLTLYAQLLFAPAVNPRVEHNKQKKRGICLGVDSAWHKVKAVVDFICSFIQIAQIENPFVTEYFTDNVCRNKCRHPAAVAWISREEKLFIPPSRSSGSHIQISLLPKRPSDTLLIAAIFQGQDLKALCGTFNDLCRQ